MSGIAGILRRDGRIVPERWCTLLEQVLRLDGSTTYRYENSVQIEPGDLHIILLSGAGLGSDPKPAPVVVVGDLEGECAFARWDEETLELELGRRGTGQKSLYWLDLAGVGDGLLFCSNPLPLLQIANELELENEYLTQGVQEYVQLGYAIDGGALLAPLYCVPVTAQSVESNFTVSNVACGISATSALDVQTLVQILGKPFADTSLLSTLWQYRHAKEKKVAVHDGLQIQKPMKSKTKELLMRFFPTYFEKEENIEHQFASRRVHLDAIASYVGVELFISPDQFQIEPLQIPIAEWLAKPQSQLGQLLEKTIYSDAAFAGLPVNQKEVIALLCEHRDGTENHSDTLFALLTLALWRQQVLA